MSNIASTAPIERPHTQAAQQGLAKVTSPVDHPLYDNELLKERRPKVEMTQSKYLPTPMAARHLGHSTSWLLRRGDIPYLPGRPNKYSVRDLDEWFERNKHQPLS